MNEKIYKKPECMPSHAGRILKSGFIDEYNLRIETVAELLGITRVHLSRIVNGHSPVTSDIAIRLEMLTKTPASQWLAIQAKYDAYVLEQGRDFQKYKKALGKWVACSLTMLPKDRRNDDKTRQLVEETAVLAKRLGRKGKDLGA